MSKIKPQIKKNNPNQEKQSQQISLQHWVEHFWCGVLDWRNSV